MKTDETALKDRLILEGATPLQAEQVVAGIRWLDHPAAANYFAGLARRHDEYAKERSNVFVPGNPNHTQEVIAQMVGGQSELERLQELPDIVKDVGADEMSRPAREALKEVFCATS